MQKYEMYIGGKSVPPAGGEWFESYDPFTGKPWALIPRGGAVDVEMAVAAASDAFHRGDWGKITATARGHLMRKLGDLIASNAERLAAIEVRDNGKLMAEMLAQLRYIPEWYYYFGGLADKIEGAVIPTDKPRHFNYTRHEPLGVVAAITPWNSPLLLAAWKLGPGLAAGNTFVLKPSEFTSASSIEFAQLFEQAGFPPGVMNVVTGFGAEVGEPLVAHPAVTKIAFTGSESGGRKVNEVASRLFKRVTLELGGKSPNIVFADANIEDAIKGVISGIFAATGQTCVAGSRLLIQRSIQDEFLDKLVSLAATARMGNPAEMTTQVGPVTTQPQYKKVLDYIGIAKGEGAQCLLGGGPATRPECGDGWFVEPTIFSGVNNKMRIAQEEVFGPVLAAIPFDDDEEAIQIANDSNFGLAAGLWTQNLNRAMELPARLQAGTVWVNTYRTISYLSPFGGFKQSGLGKESGIEAVREYLQTKSVWISTAQNVPNPFTIR